MDDGRWTMICLCGESYDKSDDARHDCTPEDAVIEMPLERAQYLRDRIAALETAAHDVLEEMNGLPRTEAEHTLSTEEGNVSMDTETIAWLRHVADQATPGEMYAGGRKADLFAATFDPQMIAAMLDVIKASETVAMFELPDDIQAKHDAALARFRQVAARAAESAQV